MLVRKKLIDKTVLSMHSIKYKKLFRKCIHTIHLQGCIKLLLKIAQFLEPLHLSMHN